MEGFILGGDSVLERKEESRLSAKRSKDFEFENDFGKTPVGLALISGDQGIILVGTAILSFLVVAFTAQPLAALITVLAGLNDFNFVKRLTTVEDKSEPESTHYSGDYRALIGNDTRLNAVEAQAEPVNETSDRVAQSPIWIEPDETEQEIEFDIDLPLRERAAAVLDALENGGFSISKVVSSQIVTIAGNQRGGKGTLLGVLAILSQAYDSGTRIHYFTAGADIYPFACERVVCRLSFPKLGHEDADARVADELFKYLKKLEASEVGELSDITLVIDELMALSDYWSEKDRLWVAKFLLSRAAKRGMQVFLVLHASNLGAWLGSKNTSGLAKTFQTGVTFVGCEAKQVKISPFQSIATATGRYFLASSSDFSKPITDGEIGIIPEWLKTEINPGTKQPDPVRTLLSILPELSTEKRRTSIQGVKNPGSDVDEITRAVEHLRRTEKRTLWEVAEEIGVPQAEIREAMLCFGRLIFDNELTALKDKFRLQSIYDIRYSYPGYREKVKIAHTDSRHKCCCCLEARSEEIHHMFYLGKEDGRRNLRAVCRRCHKDECHAKENWIPGENVWDYQNTQEWQEKLNVGLELLQNGGI